MKLSREPIALRLPLAIVKRLRAVRAWQGIPATEQIERALVDWWDSQGFTEEKIAASRRAGTRRKASARKQR